MFDRTRRAWGALPGPVRAPFDVIGATVRFYLDDGCPTYAAAMAYYAIFSVVPLGLITLSIFGIFADRQAIVDWVFTQVPLRETADVRDSVDAIVSRAQQLSVASLGFGIVFLLWSSSGVFGAVRNGLNAAAHARAERPFWRGKLIDLALVVFAGALVSLSVAATATARLLVGRLDDGTWLFVGRERALQVIGLGAAPVVTFVMFFVLYRVTPAVRPAWRDTIAAAALATVLFEVAKNVVALVIAQSSFTRDTAIYAGVGSALAFLLWMYINGSILLLGAEFGRALRARREGAGLQALPPEAVAAWGGQGDAATFTTSKLQK